MKLFFLYFGWGMHVVIIKEADLPFFSYSFETMGV
jgi:hypothetical protein